ncbi:MAG TPA: FKBP-type peptidyl-prolyl cis-trans isomerase [Opitutaceae bacterium]|nr:FKBP-type peptidyl-prolyl cis-trans isomerase [Opitutaceae bacterium]
MKSVKLVLFFLVVTIAGAPALRAQREKLPPEDLEFVEKNWPTAKKTNTGIRYIIQREGTGEMPKAGSKVAVLYTGRLLNGTLFDERKDPADAFVFRVRRGEVIEGWDQLLPLMKVGEKRLVIIPPELAYGSRGEPPRIPRDSTLVFEIELLEIRKD